METAKKQTYEVSKKEWQEEAVLDHLNCCLCGRELRFQHRVDHIHRLATEDAKCVACGIQHRSTQHPLQ
jgi:hypothetical protein